MPKLVLVAEDDTDILQLVLAVLEDAGYKVRSTMGADTLTEVKRHRPDVVLLDYQMPGMDGVRIAHEIRSDPETADMPIVAMTAAGRAALVCQEMEANGCLGKPFDIDHLIEVVSGLVHSAH